MKRSHRFHFTFYILQFAIALLSPSLVLSAQPTLARLSFWLPPNRMPEFESTYEERVVPLLKTHGLAPASEVSRTTVDSVFARLFEIKSSGDVATAQEALNEDITYTSLLQNLGTIFGTSLPDGRIRTNFQIYSTPANSGVVVPAGPGKTQTADPGKGHWRTYDTTDGLTSARVSSIFQDREGYLWFGTGGGVSRYDGQTWTTFTTKDGLVDNSVQSILQDREGNLWFGTRGGVSRYDGQTWTTFTTKDGLSDNFVWSILEDREGNFWFGTREGGVSRYDGQTWITFTTKDGLSGNFVWSIFQDREGTFWFGTDGGGISRYDGQTWTTFTTKNGLANNFVLSIFQDREGTLWFGTRGGGVSRFDPSSRLRSGQASYSEQAIWTTFTAEDGLSGNLVMAIIQDREGTFWFGTDGGGISRYDAQNITTFAQQDGFFASFQDREGNLWFGGYNGVSRYDGKTWTTFTTKDGLSGNFVSSILEDREGNLWFGTGGIRPGGGVSCYDGASFTTFSTEHGLAHNSVTSILQDREGHLYFGTRNGLTRYDPRIKSGAGASKGAEQAAWVTFTAEDGTGWQFGPIEFSG